MWNVMQGILGMSIYAVFFYCKLYIHFHRIGELTVNQLIGFTVPLLNFFTIKITVIFYSVA